MSSAINLKKKRRGWTREIIVVLFSIVLTTVGIKAGDSILNPEENSSVSNNSLCSAEMVFVNSGGGGFCIDKYEASPGEFCPGSNPSSQSETQANLDNSSCKPESLSGVVPWRNISQNQAAQACARAGKRLPTNKEWLLAAMGTPDLESNWGEEDCQVAKNWGSQPGLAGSGANCISSAGIYDMIGNVWEWVDGTIYEGKYKDRVLPEPGYVSGVDEDALPSETNFEQGDLNYYLDYFWVKTGGTRGMARGGYWDNESDAGQYSIYSVVPPSFKIKFRP